MKMFMVGGAVRDEILGVPSKDIDFTVVLDDGDMTAGEHLNAWTPYEVMVAMLKASGFEIFVDNDGEPIGAEFLTARGKFTGKGIFTADSEVYKPFKKYRGTGVDFVLSRKEANYTDGRRPDVVEPGTLMDDLRRRDFTMNAIAKDADGNLIDPFDGVDDINRRIIRAVGDPMLRLQEDALRAVRAVRFMVTKGFDIESRLEIRMEEPTILEAIEKKISDERIQQELSKMFRYDTNKSLQILGRFPYLRNALFSGSVSLDATMKTKGRGK